MSFYSVSTERNKLIYLSKFLIYRLNINLPVDADFCHKKKKKNSGYVNKNNYRICGSKNPNVVLYRVRQIPFIFLENVLKKIIEYFLKFFFYLILPFNSGK